MKMRAWVLIALLVAGVLTVTATAGAAALSAVGPLSTVPRPAFVPAPLGEVPRGVAAVRGAVLGGTSEPSAPASAHEVAGIGSNYPGTAGWMGQATVALPGDLGGRYTGVVNGHVTVCADRCARLPIVDWCQCYRGTDDARVVDLSHPAWALVSDAQLEEGLIEVRLILED